MVHRTYPIFNNGRSNLVTSSISQMSQKKKIGIKCGNAVLKRIIDWKLVGVTYDELAL